MAYGESLDSSDVRVRRCYASAMPSTGMRIWWCLRSRLRRPIALFRTTAEWISTEATRGGRSLSGIERAALERLRAEIETAGGTDVPSACEAIAALLRYGVKIEQERY